MTNPMILRLVNLAAVVEADAEARIAKYGPELRDKAHEIEVKLDEWLTAVDEHIENWDNDLLAHAKGLAFAAYRSAVSEGRDMFARVSDLKL